MCWAWARLHKVTEQHETIGSCSCAPADVTVHDRMLRSRLTANSRDSGHVGMLKRAGPEECAVLGSRGWAKLGADWLAKACERSSWLMFLQPGLEQTLHWCKRPYLQVWSAMMHGDRWLLFQRRQISFARVLGTFGERLFAGQFRFKCPTLLHW